MATINCPQASKMSLTVGRNGQNSNKIGLKYFTLYMKSM